MLKSLGADSSYSALVREARRLEPGPGPRLKIALLADVSTQHLVPLLKALFHRSGVEAEIYEAAYDAIELEAFDPRSGLYAFDPAFVIVLQSLENLKTAYYDYAEDRSRFVASRAARIEEVWNAVQARTRAHVIQGTFVVPYERPFGNFGLEMPDTLQNVVRELNREIGLRARGLPSVLIHDVDDIASWIGRRHFIDERLWALAKAPCALEHLPLVAQNLVDIVLAASGRVVKCVVLDLDNTLWGGVVGEEGLEGIGLGDLDEGGAFRSFQSYLRELSRRGVLLAVCSKNHDADARRVFREHPGMVLREEDITVFVANWEDKATNIARIREQLNIGFDAMVFVDDNPFERNLVRQLLPEVIVPELPEDPAHYVRALSELNLFEAASHSALDERRHELYQEQAVRDGDRVRFATIEDYLKSLETVARCVPFDATTLPRVAQLIQRSNQFNLTTRRYSEAECAAMMRGEDGALGFSIAIRDRFGDAGLINVVILRPGPEALEIDSFLMSCRVLQRGVEQYAMNRIFAYARDGGHERVVGRHIPTAKNSIVTDFYRQFGFTQVADEGERGTLWSLSVADYVPRPVFIREDTPGDGDTQGRA